MVKYAIILFSVVVCSMLLAVIALILTPVWLSLTERVSHQLSYSLLLMQKLSIAHTVKQFDSNSLKARNIRNKIENTG